MQSIDHKKLLFPRRKNACQKMPNSYTEVDLLDDDVDIKVNHILSRFQLGEEGGQEVVRLFLKSLCHTEDILYDFAGIGNRVFANPVTIGVLRCSHAVCLIS